MKSLELINLPEDKILEIITVFEQHNKDLIDKLMVANDEIKALRVEAQKQKIELRKKGITETALQQKTMLIKKAFEKMSKQESMITSEQRIISERKARLQELIKSSKTKLNGSMV